MKKGIYLDYSATTKTDQQVLDKINYFAQNYYANPNSKHKIGQATFQEIEKAQTKITNYFKIKPQELIFTSGATEANNLAIKGIFTNNKRHIITTPLEHSSVYGPIGYLQKQGCIIEIVPLKADGTVDINKLEQMLTEDTFLVSIVAVDSELGIRQPIEEIGLLLKNYKHLSFHSDITQCLGKEAINLENIDLASFSGHKIYCPKGIGGLIIRENIKIEPLIHGGKSLSTYRAGTPQTELIGALSEGFNLFNHDLQEKKEYVTKLNSKIKKHLKKYPSIKINSTLKAIPHILNISLLNKDANFIQQYFEKHNIYISTKTACASDTNLSKSVLTITNDKKRASSSIRISLSYKTTEEEIIYFLAILDKLMEETNEIN